ncbi:hypothetical protein [Novosphingobium mangrovi (ex Huang et al. 2023)]|uniref:Uncharacterized protein n=1 Tax=Novosphingobium mangrovi (ex Huang et al. 2023) TaxID=2976432 RepID=A0ABT2I7B5_9SPHN|nr:hypothetical protein [Novosphingobium mangrovi (ex Huang et al. 2023)]MCT2400709.1 hypothetical protein [Novosphingobium mangrovi (ex Huang et al. 2023)]
MKSVFFAAVIAAAIHTVEPSAVAAATTQIVPPPPVVMASSLRGSTRASENPIAVVDVTVEAGRGALWTGVLKIDNSGASYSESLRDAPEPCDDKAGNASASNFSAQRQFNLSIRRYNRNGAPDLFSVNARWTRPIPFCEGQGTRSVSLDQQVDLVPGRTVRLTGDGGLVVTITRRAN